MRLLILPLFFFIHFGAFADCDLFKEEVKIISEDIKDMYKDLYESSEFVDEASENKSEINNEKLGRLLNETKSKLDRIEHGMSQLKLHQDCACEDFKFQFVDNLLIEIKFWLKKGSDIDLSKPKKTNYSSIKSNTEKALSKATDLQIYFIDPCKEKKSIEEHTPEASAENISQPNNNDSSITKTSTVDPTPLEEEKNSNEALMAESSIENGTQKEETTGSENRVSNDPESSTNSSAEDGMKTNVSGAASKSAVSVSGAAVGTAAIAAGAAVAISNDKEKTKEELENKSEEPLLETQEAVNELAENNTEPKEIDNEATELTTQETNTNSKIDNLEENQPTIKTKNFQKENNSTNPSGAVSGGVSNASGAAVGATAIAAGAAVALVTSNDKEKTKEGLENKAEEPLLETDETQNELAENNTESNVIDNEAPESTTQETNTNSEIDNVEENQPTLKAENSQTKDNSTPNTSNAVSGGVSNASGAAIGSTAIAAGAAADVVTSNEKEKTKEELEIKAEEAPLETDETQTDLTEGTNEIMGSEKENNLEEPETKEENISEINEIVEPITEPAKPKETAPAPAPAPETTISNNFHYAVQIATGNANTSEGKYAALEVNIYSVQESGMNKYRIGKYDNLNDAVNTKKKAFNGGFLDAFVVAYNNGERISMQEAKSIEKGENTSPPTNTKSVPVESKKADRSSKIKRNSEVVLAIQIGASITSTDPVYELVKYERKIGMEVHVLQGSPIRFYTGPTKDKNQAELTLGKVKATGINEAFLIGVANGKRVEYQEALNFLGK